MQYTPVSDVMWFQSLLTLLHFVNNLTVSEMEKKDKLWKLRPWLDSFRKKCLQVVLEEHNSVDEMMIPFKGKSRSIKQYMRGKPHPWGFKLWVRTGISALPISLTLMCTKAVSMEYKPNLNLDCQVILWWSLSPNCKEGQTYKWCVDLLDSSAAKYKLPMKLHRWYMYIFWHTIILAVVSAWLLYKWDCKALKIS